MAKPRLPETHWGRYRHYKTQRGNTKRTVPAVFQRGNTKRTVPAVFCYNEVSDHENICLSINI